MPDLLEPLNALCTTSFDCPIVDVEGWRFFFDRDGFLPSANNLKLVTKVLAWNASSVHHYCAIVGNRGSAFRYEKGQEFPQGAIDGCIIDAHFVMREGVRAVEIEMEHAARDLVHFVCAAEGLPVPEIALPA